MIKNLLKKLHAPVYEERLKCLTGLILARLQRSDKVLDVGCGGGALGAKLMQAPAAPSGLVVEGLEKHPRGGEPIPVHRYEGEKYPFEDNSFDVVCLLDVLHHDQDILSVLLEAARVAKRLVIIKDHKPDGLFAQARICTLDWAANFGYGVKCLYYYPTHSEWKHLFEASELLLDEEIISMQPYPALWNIPFGGRLHYMAFAHPSRTNADDAAKSVGKKLLEKDKR